MDTRRKVSIGLASILLLAGVTGVAVASDDAAPGDALYGVDQALTTLDIDDGGLEEAIEEAESLNENTKAAEALGHAADAVEEAKADREGSSPEEAKVTQGLMSATESVLSEGDEESLEVRTAVAAMLACIADPWGIDCENVATMAQGISGAPDELPDAAENAADEAGLAEESAEDATEEADLAEENAENADDAGPPEDVPTDPPVDVPAGP